MPQLLVAPLAGYLGTLGMGTIMATAVSHIAIGAGLGLIQNALTKKMMGRQSKGQGVSFQTQMGDTAALSIVVGQYATGGKRKYIGSWGKGTRYITEVIEYSAMPQGLNKVWVNDEEGVWHSSRRWAIPSSASPSSIGNQEEVATVPSGAIDAGRPLSNMRDDGNRIYVKVVDGTQTAADPFLVWAFGSHDKYPWTANMVGKGKSYVIITTRYDSDTLTSYPKFLIEPSPLALYDPRKDSSTGGSGSHRWGNPSTYEPTSNTAVIAYNVARGIYYGDEHIFGGQSYAAWRLPRAAWVAAMNACDASVLKLGGGSEPYSRCGMEIALDGSTDAIEALDTLGLAANMRYSVVGGTLKPVVGVSVAASMFMTDETIMIDEGQSFTPFKPMGDSYNAISSTYPSRVEKWASKESPEYVDAESLAKDGNRYRPLTMDYSAVPFPDQVQRLQIAQLKDYRRERYHSFIMPPEASALEPAIDSISWTSARNGYIAKRFNIETATKGMDLRTTVTMREVDPADYDWNVEWESPFVETTPVATLLPVQIAPDFEVYGFIQKDPEGKNRRPALVVQVAADENAISGVQIQVRRDGEAEWTHDTTVSYVTPYRWVITSLLPNTLYWARVKLHSRMTPRSTWSIEKDATTPNIFLTMDDLADELADDLERLHEWIDEDLPQRLVDQAAAYRELVDRMRDVAGEAIEHAARAHVIATADREYLVTAEQSLTAKIGMTDDQVLILAQAISSLQAAIPGLATSTALQALTATVTTQGNNITSVASDVTALQTSVAGKANSSAVSALASEVSDIDGEVTAIATALTQLGAISSAGTAQTIMKMQAESSPSGVLARIGLKALVGDNTDNSRVAAIFLEALSGGQSRAIIEAARFAVATSGGRTFPFIIDGSNVYINQALIKTAMIETAHIKNGAVTNRFAAYNAASVGSGSSWANILSLSIDTTGQPMSILTNLILNGATGVDFRLMLGSTVVREWRASAGYDFTASIVPGSSSFTASGSISGWANSSGSVSGTATVSGSVVPFLTWNSNETFYAQPVTMALTHTFAAGSHTLTLQTRKVTGRGTAAITNRFLEVTELKR